jgi:nucleotide-binding universal stress UspA family protein
MAAEPNTEAVATRGGKSEAAFAGIVCGVDGSRGSVEAARQAIALAKPDGKVQFLTISRQLGNGFAAMAALGDSRAQEALQEVTTLAREAGVAAETALRKNGAASQILLGEGRRHDLLVVGSRGGSRASGIFVGSTASQLAHRTDRPLLIARRTPEEESAEAALYRRKRPPEFPRAVLLASDGSPASWIAAGAAARIAHARRSTVAVIHVPRGLHPQWGRQIGKQMAMLSEATGTDAVLLGGPGRIPERIAEAAMAADASLIVIGRRGLRGWRALRSVSERVVHQASCSVLTVPRDVRDPEGPP